MKNESSHIKSVVLFAGVIIPEIESNTKYLLPFTENYLRLITDIDADSQKKIRLLVNVFSKLSYIYNLSSLNNLSYSKRQKYVDKMFHFPFSKFVSGLTGLRALCMISYYNIEEVMHEIKYDGPVK